MRLFLHPAPVNRAVPNSLSAQGNMDRLRIRTRRKKERMLRLATLPFRDQPLAIGFHQSLQIISTLA